LAFKDSLNTSGLNAFSFHLFFNLSYLLDFIVAFYGGYFLIAPLLFNKKKYFLALFFTIVVAALIVWVRYVGEFYVNLPLLKFNNYFDKPIQFWPYVKNCLLYTYRYSLWGVVIYFVRYSWRMEKEKREIQQQRVEAELALLKSQVNPHFLFNTINDIYSLVYKKDALASEALLKLSSLLRYMLEGNHLEYMPLGDELQYLRDYIQLQRIGMKGGMCISFTVSGDPGSNKISPMLLIPFAENIFKHGVISDASEPAALNIDIAGTVLTFSSSNKIRYQQKNFVRGISLDNVRKRLELIYPGRHCFYIEQDENKFSCKLEIELQNK